MSVAELVMCITKNKTKLYILISLTQCFAEVPIQLCVAMVTLCVCLLPFSWWNVKSMYKLLQELDNVLSDNLALYTLTRVNINMQLFIFSYSSFIHLFKMTSEIVF